MQKDNNMIPIPGGASALLFLFLDIFLREASLRWTLEVIIYLARGFKLPSKQTAMKDSRIGSTGRTEPFDFARVPKLWFFGTT